MKNAAGFLGCYYGETVLSKLLDDLGIHDAPKLGKGDSDTGLLAPDRGVELTFTDEDELDVKPAEAYPDGALVLSNIRFYGDAADGFDRFNGHLPFDLHFGTSKDAVKAQMPGMPSEYLNGQKLRWIMRTHVVFAKFSNDELAEVGVQLPLA